MPMLHLQTTVTVPEDQRQDLLAGLSKIVTAAIGKPETCVMIRLDETAMLMAGKTGPAAWVEVRSIGGLNAKVNAHLSAKICAFLRQSLAIAPERIYLNFLEIEANQWGWKGETFG